MTSGPSSAVLARVSLSAAFTLFFILFHVARGSGSAFKTSLTGANPDPLVSSQKTLAHQVARQLHSHEHSGHEETQEDTDEANEQKKKPVEFRYVGCIGSVQDYET